MQLIEVLLFSIIVGTISFIMLGYLFGDIEYYNNLGQRVKEGYGNVKKIKTNYTIGIIGFILSTCISFYYLKSINKTK
ncbi:hypothetical protein SAMN05421738_1125 [Algoriella xinjiangensis]|uniref:Uncharacterized protein n=1 Tax=Algoriella xinjiangensis TaxID=684065 RepID=A0A1I4YV98_9FLAO|nr:hypothetical protein SAMN05421738_1125 [Algoriella xinjiangensis]